MVGKRNLSAFPVPEAGLWGRPGCSPRRLRGRGPGQQQDLEGQERARERRWEPQGAGQWQEVRRRGAGTW